MSAISHQATTPAPLPFIGAGPHEDAAVLQQRIAEHGHLFFKNLLPRDAVLAARAEAISVIREAGWIENDADPLAARWTGRKPAPGDLDPEWLAFYRGWIEWPEFNALPEHPAMLELANKLLGDDVLVHRCKIGRIGFPQNEGQHTHAHQDFFHVEGSTETYTAWVPLGDCPTRLGCLMVGDGTHKAGLLEHRPSSGPGSFAVDSDDITWRAQDFEVGDVLVFHALLVHQALSNRTADEVRISLDNRYQRASDPVGRYAMQPHLSG